MKIIKFKGTLQLINKTQSLKHLWDKISLSLIIQITKGPIC